MYRDYGEHTFSTYQKYNSSEHKRTCTTCNKVEYYSHTWNSGVVTKDSTCAETGIKTFTCTVCSETKTEVIAKKTTHTYGNYEYNNSTTHIKKCTICGISGTTQNHSWNKYLCFRVQKCFKVKIVLAAILDKKFT